MLVRSGGLGLDAIRVLADRLVDLLGLSLVEQLIHDQECDQQH
jgi:hypothetical protein